jgi:hypothetical protein
MGLGRRTATITAAGLVAALAAGCGSSQGLLNARDNDHLRAQLLAVREAVNAGNCARTSDALAELDTVIDGLPPQTNRTLDRNLRQGATVVRDNATRQCHHKAPKPPVTTTTTTTTSTSASATTTTQTQASSTSTPAPTTPTATATTPPPTSATATTPPPSSGTTTGNGGGGLTPGGGGRGGGKGKGGGDG